MGNISQNTPLLTLLFIVTTSTIFITTNNAQTLLPQHVSSHLTTQPPSHAHAPAPSPSHHHHHSHKHLHHHSPALAPSPSYASAPPKPQPSKPVTPSPPSPVGAKAPAAHGVKRQLVAVQGMVYCKSNCTTTNVAVDNLLGASPLPGARVVLRCRNTQYLLRKTATTNKNGYFFMEAPPAVTTYGAHKCKVYLAQKLNGPSSSSCSNATDLNNGVTGAYLFSNNTGPPNNVLPNFSLFSVGPFAYASATCYKD